MKTHQMCGTPTYWSWLAMRVRCTYPGSRSYPDYGGRGIKVCERWADSFENFYADMGLRPLRHTLSRRDNDGDYSPDNCAWADVYQQAKNKRSTIAIRIDGETMCLKDWCRRFGLGYVMVYKRLQRGWALERALQVEGCDVAHV